MHEHEHVMNEWIKREEKRTIEEHVKHQRMIERDGELKEIVVKFGLKVQISFC